ncbi:MAG: type II secretion system F family protein [Acidimicrobiales bacterium]
MVTAAVARRRARRRLAVPAPGDRAIWSAAPVERWLAPRLSAADVAWPPAVVAQGAALAAATAGGLGLVGGGPVLALLAVLVVVGASAGTLLAAGGRREARVERELPALLEAVARGLRSGAAIPTALREAAATGSVAAQDLATVLVDVDRGLSFGVAFDRWAKRRPRPGVRLVVGALSMAMASGGTPARAVDGVAATLRERAEVDREVRALATQARASAAVVTLAPLAFGALGALGDERTATFLLRTPAGLACLVSGLVLDGIGAAWMVRIARGAA